MGTAIYLAIAPERRTLRLPLNLISRRRITRNAVVLRPRRVLLVLLTGYTSCSRQLLGTSGFCSRCHHGVVAIGDFRRHPWIYAILSHFRRSFGWCVASSSHARGPLPVDHLAVNGEARSSNRTASASSQAAEFISQCEPADGHRWDVSCGAFPSLRYQPQQIVSSMAVDPVIAMRARRDFCALDSLRCETARWREWISSTVPHSSSRTVKANAIPEGLQVTLTPRFLVVHLAC